MRDRFEDIKTMPPIDRLKKFIKSVFTDKALSIFLLITLIMFGSFVLIQFSKDSYGFMGGSPANDEIYSFMSAGRFLIAGFIELCYNILHLSGPTVYRISFVMAIIFTTLSMYGVWRIFRDKTKHHSLLFAAAILVVANPFSFDLFYYTEKGLMMFAVLMSVLAVSKMKDFFLGKKSAIASAFILLALASISYQGALGIFVALSMLLIIIYSSSVKDFIKKNFQVAACYGLPLLTVFIIIKILTTIGIEQDRLVGSGSLVDRVSSIFNKIITMVGDMHQLLPPYFFVIILGIVILWTIFEVIKHNDNLKTKILRVLSIPYLVAGTILASVAPFFVMTVDMIWLSPRSTYVYASLIGIIIIYLITLKIRLHQKLIKMIGCLVILYLAVQYVYFMKLINSNHLLNYNDRIITEKIQLLVNKYEADTNKTVNKIELYRDASPQFTYSNVMATLDINDKAYGLDWGTEFVLNYYANNPQKYHRKPKDEYDLEIQKWCNTTNWDEFDSEQIKFTGDTIHICSY